MSYPCVDATDITASGAFTLIYWSIVDGDAQRNRYLQAKLGKKKSGS